MGWSRKKTVLNMYWNLEKKENGLRWVGLERKRSYILLYILKSLVLLLLLILTVLEKKLFLEYLGVESFLRQKQ
jgi:hypothetical protein